MGNGWPPEVRMAPSRFGISRPSRSLEVFLRDGARRFVFEGRECGGHVGPRTSFVLWETMIEVLREHPSPDATD